MLQLKTSFNNFRRYFSNHTACSRRSAAIAAKTAVLTGIVLVCGCSGGGGGGSGGGGRTDDTAVRIVHGAIDQAPVDLSVDGLFTATAKFGDSTQYVPVADGAHSFGLTAVNSPATVVGSLTGNLEKQTEYSLILFGKEEGGSFSVQLVPDQVARPEKGFAAVRVIHSVASQGPLTVTANTTAIPETAFGKVSPFTTVPSGATQFVVRNRDGGTIGTASAVIEDQGEITVLISGDQTLGAYFVTLLSDLD